MNRTIKILMVAAILAVATAPIIVIGRNGNKFGPTQTTVANWLATSTPIPDVVPSPTPDCCRGGHDWMPTEAHVTHQGGCDGTLPLARCRNCGLWRSND